MIVDMQDANLKTVVVTRGTDHSYHFIPRLPSGSTFVWSQYDLICEVRISKLSFTPLFTIAVDKVEVEEVYFARVVFGKDKITTSIRETNLPWRVLATNKTTQEVIELTHGALQLL